MQDIIKNLNELNIDTKFFSENDFKKIKEYTQNPSIDFGLEFYNGIVDTEKRTERICSIYQKDFVLFLNKILALCDSAISVCHNNCNMFGEINEDLSKTKILEASHRYIKESEAIIEASMAIVQNLYCSCRQITELENKYDNLIYEMGLIHISTKISKSNSSKITELVEMASNKRKQLSEFSKAVFNLGSFIEAICNDILHSLNKIALKLDFDNDGKSIALPCVVDELNKIEKIVLNATEYGHLRKDLRI